MNIKNCGRRNVSKHRDIKGSDKYITLDIWLEFGSLDKIIITYSEPKHSLGRPGKGLMIILGIKANSRPKKYKKIRYAIVNFSMIDPSKISRQFLKLPTNL